MSTVNSITGVAATEHTEYAERTGVATQNTGSSNADAFNAILNQTLSNMNTNTGTGANAGLAGMPGAFLPVQSQNDALEQAIMTASDSGSSNDAMIALVMMLMMMQSSEGGDFSVMMQFMATMLGNIINPDELRHEFMMNSGGDPFILDTMDRHIFAKPMPDMSDTGKVVLPLEWWRPAKPIITNTPGRRSPDALRAVVEQFNVESAERYRPGREGNTYCNIFVWDVTRAMGAELPFYTDRETGEPRYHPDTKGAKAMGAIAMDKWLQDHGERYGWQEIDAETAQRHANMGRPVVTTSGSIGHVQIVVPSKDGSFDPVRGVTIAQAGRQNSNYMYISGSYNAHRLNNHVRYWVHP